MPDYEDITRQLMIGIAEAMDPDNASGDHDGPIVTTRSSAWIYDSCVTCGHSFRAGDEVAVDETGIVRHHSAMLPCSGEGEFTGGGDKARATIQAFFKGLEETWPPPEHLPIIRLEEGHPLLAPPMGRMRRRSCAFCGHTFRPRDQVIICPCSPGEPKCLIAIHRDPMHGLNCWETWNPGSVLRHCPMSSRPLG